MLQQLHSVHLPNLRVLACYFSVHSVQKSAVAHCQSQIDFMPSQGNCMPSRGNAHSVRAVFFKLMARKLQIMCFVQGAEKLTQNWAHLQRSVKFRMNLWGRLFSQNPNQKLQRFLCWKFTAARLMQKESLCSFWQEDRLSFVLTLK